MSGTSPRIYLDHAATTWPKCAEAVQASSDFLRHCGATAGRGSYASSQIADEHISRARSQLAKLLGANDPRSIAFASSGTHALNALIFGIIPAGAHVVTTSMEHNSVLRPLAQMRASGKIQLDVATVNRQGLADASAAESLIQTNTRALIVGHASNVTGAVQELTEWRKLADQHNLPLLVDASQTLGYVPIHTAGPSKIDGLAAAGHKGLRALPGTGLVMLRPELWADFRPLMYGGTGRTSESMLAEPQWPEHIEVGNLNVPAIISMGVAAESLLREQDLYAGWHPVFRRLCQGLEQIDGLKIVGDFSSENSQQRVPVVSVQIDDWDVHDFAAILNDEFGIEVRTGFHCAAMVHEAIGTVHSHGTLRLSCGRSTTQAEVDTTLQAIRQLLE